VGRWLSRRHASQEPGETEKGGAGVRGTDGAGAGGEGSGGAPAGGSDAPARRRAGDAASRQVTGPQSHLEGFPCQLGDVVMRITGEEAWLAGGVALSEEVPVAALFVAPDAGHDCALYVRPKPREGIFWMAPLDPGAVLVAGEPPSAVEHAGVRFDRVRRLPLRPRRLGVGAPDVGDAVVVAEYASAGMERLLVLKGSTGSVHAYHGTELEPSSYEVIASGRSTLDDP